MLVATLIIICMKQTTLNLQLSVKKTRKLVFLEQMEVVVPWSDLVERIAPYYLEERKGRPPFSLYTMLHVKFQHLKINGPLLDVAVCCSDPP